MSDCKPNKVKRNVSFTEKNVSVNIQYRPKKVNSSIAYSDKTIIGDLCFNLAGVPSENDPFDYTLDFLLS